MIIKAIVRVLKAAVDAVAKAIAWLLIALGLWVPLVYTLIFLIVAVVFIGVPLEKTGTIYFLGLFLSFIGALWFSLAVSARKSKRKRKNNSKSYNITDVKKKKSDKEKPEDPPQIETTATDLQTEQQGENQMRDPYNNRQRQFNNEPYGDDGSGYGFQQQPQPRDNWSQQNRNYDQRRFDPEPYNDPNVQSTYENNDRKSWLNENPYSQQNNNYDSRRSDQGGRPNWLHETEQNYEPRRKPTFEPYNTDQKQNQNYGSQKPAFEPYNNEPKDRLDEGNNFTQSTFNRDRRRASFEPYGNENPRTQFEQNYGRNDSLGQNNNSTKSDIDFDRGRRSFDSYAEPQRYNNNDTFDRSQRYNDAPYNNQNQRYNDAPYNGQNQRYDDDSYNRQGGQAYDQRQNDRYDGGYGRGTNVEPPRRNDRNVPPPPSPQGNYYNNGGYNGYNNEPMGQTENQGGNNPPPRNPYETPRIFRLREDPDMLVYEYSDRLDYYRRTPYGNVYVRTKMK